MSDDVPGDTGQQALVPAAEVFPINVTTHNVAAFGLHVVRVVSVPGSWDWPRN